MYGINNIDVAGFFIYRTTRKLLFASLTENSEFYKNGKLLRGPDAMKCRSQWPRGLRRRSSAARLLRSWVRIPPGTWMFVCCECCVLSGKGLCVGLITRPEESYWLWSVVCDLETSNSRRLKPATGLCKIQPQWVVTPGKQTTNKQMQWNINGPSSL